jgi:hypothetical protein
VEPKEQALYHTENLLALQWYRILYEPIMVSTVKLHFETKQQKIKLL